MTTEAPVTSRPERVQHALGPVVILVPVLHRPHRVAPLLASIEAATRHEHRVLFITDPGDWEEIDAIEDAGARRIAVAGNYARKINLGARVSWEPLIFLGADDLNFHPDWLTKAAARIDPIDGPFVVGTNDLCNPAVIDGRHATHFLVHRNYLKRGTIDEPFKLLHEGYEHEFVDNEFIETAKARDVYAHAGDSIVEHLHPMVGKAPMDELYAGMSKRMRSGRQVFDRRKRLWRS